jgi:flagellar protein FlaG
MADEIKQVGQTGSEIPVNIPVQGADNTGKESIDKVRDTARRLELDDAQERIISKGLLPNGEELFREKLEQIVNDANQVLTGFNASLSFEIHKSTDTLMVRLTDRNTHEVIREMPSKEFLDLQAKLSRYNSIVLSQLA